MPKILDRNFAGFIDQGNDQELATKNTSLQNHTKSNEMLPFIENIFHYKYFRKYRQYINGCKFSFQGNEFYQRLVFHYTCARQL